VVEQAPVRQEDEERGVVGEGAVGAAALARLALFRYEVRRWREALIPDIDEAVESPNRLSDNPDCARRLLELVPQVPTPVWGRDELRAGEMWNSNSTISWLIARIGLDVESIALPRRPKVGKRGGSAPLFGRERLEEGRERPENPERDQHDRRDQDRPQGRVLPPPQPVEHRP
jgi:hypothetical protein